jgi:hypothetical protein
LDSPLAEEEVLTKSESLDIISDNDQHPVETEKVLISKYSPQPSETKKNIASDAPAFTKESLDSPLDLWIPL